MLPFSQQGLGVSRQQINFENDVKFFEAQFNPKLFRLTSFSEKQQNRVEVWYAD